MRMLFFGILCLVFVSVLQFVPEAQAAGTGYYVAPNGSGSSCTPATPCALITGLNKAQAGDEVVLMDGVYNATIKTQRSGVTIRAQNTHGAIVRSTSSKYLGRIEHSNITVRGIRFDGKPTILTGKGSLLQVLASNVTIESNIVENSHAAGISVQAILNSTISNIILRHNLIQETGFSGPGEAVYIGLSDGSATRVQNLQIYGNTFRRFTSNGIDLKGNSRNADIHHNIFEGQHYKPNPDKGGTEGTVVTTAADGAHRIHNNIFRNSSQADPSTFHFAARGGNKIHNNVVFNVTSKHAIATRTTGSGTPTEVTGNTFCDMSSYGVQNTDGMNVHNNPGIPGGVPQSQCDTQVQRILNERKHLPGVGNPTFLSPSNLRLVRNG